MDLAATPLHPLFAARLAGADLSQPVNDGLARAIERAMDTYAVCVLPDQNLDDERQIAFARLYGPLEVSPPQQNKSGGISFNTRVKHREIFDVSNSMSVARSSTEATRARCTGSAISSGTPTARSGRSRPPGRCCTRG